MRRLEFLSIILCALAIFAMAPTVSAHANLVRSEPAANSATPAAPTRVRAWFSEQVEPRFSTILVLDASGTPRDLGDSHLLAGDAQAMEVSIPELSGGLYTVVWRTLSAVDGHTTTGSFVFTIGDKPLAEASPRQIITQVDAALNARALPPTQEIVVRWLNLVLLILLTGGLFFPLLILMPVATPAAHNRDVWKKRWLAFARITLALYALVTIAVLVLQANTAGGGAESITTLLSTTRFGSVWLLRAALVIALGAILFRKFDATPNSLRLPAILGLGLIISTSLNSHGAAVGEPPVIPFVADALHLLGAAIWVGGLAQWLVTIPAFLRPLDPRQKTRELAALITRFSLVAFLVVGIVIATGAFALFVQVGSFDAFFGTLYGTALFVKMVLILPLLALGAWNLIVVRPALARVIAERARNLIARFNISVALEVSFALAVLFIVGIITSAAPAGTAYAALPQLWLESRRVDDLIITLGIAPGLVGSNDFDVKVQDAAGQPVSNASVVRVLGDMREMNMGTQELTAQPQGGGHYTLRADLLSMIGTWNLQVLVRRNGRDDARASFSLIAQPKPAASITSTPFALTQPEGQIGLVLALLGFSLGTASTLLIKLRTARWASLFGAIMVASIGALAVYQTAASQPPAQAIVIPVVPEFARLQRIPFRIDANRLANGQVIYQQNCATCHGANGKGEGPAAFNLNPRPFDLTIHVPLHSDGELHWLVSQGISGTAMPAWNKTLTDDQLWEITAYVRRTFGGSASTTP